jgi:hypothetical protein
MTIKKQLTKRMTTKRITERQRDAAQKVIDNQLMGVIGESIKKCDLAINAARVAHDVRCDRAFRIATKARELLDAKEIYETKKRR